MIYEIKRYADEKDHVITARVPTAPVFPLTDLHVENSIPTYIGTLMVQTQRGPMQIPFPFPPELSLEQCFEKYEEHEKAALAELQDASRIVSASGMPLPPPPKPTPPPNQLIKENEDQGKLRRIGDRGGNRQRG